MLKLDIKRKYMEKSLYSIDILLHLKPNGFKIHWKL